MPPKSAREQLGVDLPDPPDPEPPQPEPEPPAEDRPDFLLDKFKTVEDQAKGYAEAERKISEQAESQRRLEAQLQQLTEVVEGFQAPEQQQQTPGTDEAIRARLQQFLQYFPFMNLWIQPILQNRTVEYYRHSIMNLAHESIGRRCQNRKRATFKGSAWSPCIPNACDTHNRITLQINLEGTLSPTFRLPFVKAT